MWKFQSENNNLTNQILSNTAKIICFKFSFKIQLDNWPTGAYARYFDTEETDLEVNNDYKKSKRQLKISEEYVFRCQSTKLDVIIRRNAILTECSSKRSEIFRTQKLVTTAVQQNYQHKK